VKPRLVQAITDRQGQILRQFPPEDVRRVVSTQTARTLKDIMQTVMLPGGTGVNASLEGYTACGKTGTARKVDETGQYSNERHVASFIGFAPVENPKVAVLVVIDEPKGQIYGGHRGPRVQENRPDHPQLSEHPAAQRHGKAEGVHGQRGRG
jgi:cell division protein FtsI (penicillin-binding protein 3)